MSSLKGICRSVKIGLLLTGIWPGMSYELIVRLVWFISMMTVQVCQFRYIVKHMNFVNLADLVDSVGTTMPYSLLCYKLIIFWSKHEAFRKILVEMSNDWTNSSVTKLDSEVMENKAELADRCSKLIIGVYAVAVFLYTSVFFEFFRQDEKQGEEFDKKSRELLIKMDFPFAYQESPTYEYVFAVQFVHLLATATAIGMLDALIVTLIFHIGGQIEVLHEALANVCTKYTEKELPKMTVKSLIDRHYRIIVSSENIENLFTSIALMQLLCNTLVICCIGFLIVIALHSDENIRTLIKISFFYLAITLEAFIFSFAGEYLSKKNLSISISAYNSLWYLLKPSDRRFVIILMIRSQKRLTITAGKFVDLTFETFANILKTSASYVSVLYAMY